MDFIRKLFDTSDFPARWTCGSWDQFHGWLHIISDLGVFSAYMAIPIVLSYVILRRKDLPFSKLFWLFAGFIAFCGSTHLIEVIIFWWPIYRFAGLVKLGTAIISWTTVIILIRNLPNILALKTPNQLESEVHIRTSRLELEIERRKNAEDDLKKLNEQKDDFLAMLGHELRNPLTPLRNGLSILELGGLEDQTEVLSLMKRQIHHMIHIIDDLLDVSRISRGKIELKLEVLDLVQLLQETYESCKSEAERAKHKITLNIPTNPVWVYGDRVRLTQAVSNLLYNSIKYTPTGDGLIILSLDVFDNSAVVRVVDNGIGIDQNLIVNIFDTFVQGDNSIERTQGGLGIGLTIVERIIEKHNGTVEASSKGPGQGSEFSIYLPLHEQIPEVSTFEKTKEIGDSFKILIIEDNEGAAKLLAKLLTRFWNHKTLLAFNGIDGIETAIIHKPDLIICDIGLPKINGYDVVRRLRQQPGINNKLIVALTGYGQSEDRQKALDAGFDEHITKPASVEVLAQLFEHPKLRGIE